jgi:hypothetical protein
LYVVEVQDALHDHPDRVLAAHLKHRAFRGSSLSQIDPFARIVQQLDSILNPPLIAKDWSTASRYSMSL